MHLLQSQLNDSHNPDPDHIFKEYAFHATVTPTADGKTTVAGELERTGVPDTWKDVVPLGTLAATHQKEAVNFVVPGKIDKLSIRDYEELLADVKQ